MHAHAHAHTMHAHMHAHTHAPMTWAKPGRKRAVHACIQMWDFRSTWMCRKNDRTPHKQHGVIAWKQGCACMAQRSLCRASACPSRCTLPSAHLPLCCDGVTAPSLLTSTCSDARNGQRNDCGQVHLPCSCACALTFAPIPSSLGLVRTAAKSASPQK